LIRAALVLCAALCLSAACNRDPPPPSPPAPAAPAASSSTALADDTAELRFPAPKRLVAIGDVHGDLAAARRALRIAGAIDDADKWIGGELVLVQTGDRIDRGNEDRAVLDLFERLAEEAKKAGGTVHALNGNHELMNVAGDFRYVSKPSFEEFAGLGPGIAGSDPRILRFPEPYRPRAAAFAPGGTYARKLAALRVVVIVGDSVFVHGGVSPAHVRYGLGKVNREVRAWLEGGAGAAPSVVTADDGLVWTRRYSERPTPKDCADLSEVLDLLGAKRLVVGHTVQKEGITEGCGGKVWRVDVGMSAFYGGKTEVLEVVGGDLRRLGETPK
jgi:hypothetical protein